MGLMWGWLVVLVLFRGRSGWTAMRVTAAGLGTALLSLQWLAFSGFHSLAVFVASAAGGALLHRAWWNELRLDSSHPVRTRRS